MKISKSDFDIEARGRGHYFVRYTTPSRGDYYEGVITDTEAIAVYGTKTTLRRLR